VILDSDTRFRLGPWLEIPRWRDRETREAIEAIEAIETRETSETCETRETS
jgi:hypothetical protein